MTRSLLILSASIALCCSPSLGQDRERFDEGFGLSVRYPDDRGIANDPAVLFAEDFESGEVAELSKRWTDLSNLNDGTLSYRDDLPVTPIGKRSLQVTATVSKNTGGSLYKKLPRGSIRLSRFYVRFPEEAGYVHHFVHFGGYNPATNWAQGGAGEKPRGDDRMQVGIEPVGEEGRREAPGIWNFYPYWHEMKMSADKRYWGNAIQSAEPAIVPRGRWQCIEIMMKANTPGERNGELALWIDGKLNMHVRQGTPREAWTGMGFRLADRGGEPFEGFSWRTTTDLKINFFWLLHYVTESNLQRNRVGDISKPVTVWFDNIVVSERYVGPIKTRNPARRPILQNEPEGIAEFLRIEEELQKVRHDARECASDVDRHIQQQIDFRRRK